MQIQIPIGKNSKRDGREQDETEDPDKSKRREIPGNTMTTTRRNRDQEVHGRVERGTTFHKSNSGCGRLRIGGETKHPKALRNEILGK
jgi:hypothetical protein